MRTKTPQHQDAEKPVRRIIRGNVEVEIWERRRQEARFYEAAFSCPNRSAAALKLTHPPL